MRKSDKDTLVNTVQESLRTAEPWEVPHLNLALSALHDLQNASADDISPPEGSVNVDVTITPPTTPEAPQKRKWQFWKKE